MLGKIQDSAGHFFAEQKKASELDIIHNKDQIIILNEQKRSKQANKLN